VADGPSAVEFPAYPPLGQVDEDTVYAYELAVKLHEARYRRVPRVIKVASPAAGADFVQVVDTGTVWIPLMLRAVFTASAAVATRFVEIRFDDQSTPMLSVLSTQTVTASQSWTFNMARGVGTFNAQGTGSLIHLPMPTVPLFGGLRIRSVTGAIDVADQWSSVSMYVIELQEATINERAELLRAYVTGEHSDLYPGIMEGI
jgi:hypothetical protein